MSSLLCVYVTSSGHDTHTQLRAHLTYVNGWSLRATQAVWLKDQTQNATWRLALRRPKLIFCNKSLGNEHRSAVVDCLWSVNGHSAQYFYRIIFVALRRPANLYLREPRYRRVRSGRVGEEKARIFAKKSAEPRP